MLIGYAMPGPPSPTVGAMRIQRHLNVWLGVMLRRDLSGDVGEKRPIYRRISNRSDGGRDAQRSAGIRAYWQSRTRRQGKRNRQAVRPTNDDVPYGFCIGEVAFGVMCLRHGWPRLFGTDLVGEASWKGQARDQGLVWTRRTHGVSNPEPAPRWGRAVRPSWPEDSQRRYPSEKHT